MLLVRGLPALLLYPQLARRDRYALGFYSATGLPLIVAIAEIAFATWARWAASGASAARPRSPPFGVGKSGASRQLLIG